MPRQLCKTVIVDKTTTSVESMEEAKGAKEPKEAKEAKEENVVTENEAKTTDTKPKKTNPKKEPKPKKVKNNGFNVPPKSNDTNPNKWAIYIFNTIKEAAPTLLERDDVRTAYNNLVEILNNAGTHFRTSMTMRQRQYNVSYIKITQEMELPLYRNYLYRNGVYDETAGAEERRKMNQDILNSYTVLYELIKRDVVPFIEIKEHEYNQKTNTVYFRKCMERVDGSIRDCENIIRKYEQNIAQTNKQIERHRKTLGDYAQKMLDLEKPPQITKFD